MKLIISLGVAIAAVGLAVAVPYRAEAAIRKEPALEPFVFEPLEMLVIPVFEPSLESPKWVPPESAAPYLSSIAQAEKRYSLPPLLLARVLYQESRYRQDIISGDLKSSAGAVGIAQIVPRWHPDINPFDPFASIDYAGKYLRQLYDRFGSWREALAAYNWGQGNLSKKGLQNAPKETRNYYSEILADVEV